jgi:hypothetical protein
MRYLKTYEGESIFTTMKRMYKKEVGTYEDLIHIYIKVFNKDAFIESKFMDNKTNQYLMNILDKEFDLDFIKKFGLNKLKIDKIDKVKDFLIKDIGLEFIDFSDNSRKEYFFKGKMSFKDLKNLI